MKLVHVCLQQSRVTTLLYVYRTLSISSNGSLGGRVDSPLTASQVACKGFRTDSHKLTSMSSVLIPDSICFWISAEYHQVNWSFINRLASPLTVRSRGWKKCVIFAGTDTTSIFSDANFDKTLSDFWPLNTSQTSSAF